YRIELDLWPNGRVVIAGLGRRFDTFARALAQARNQARVVGLLAHGLGAPEVFDGAVLDDPNPGRAEIHVYDTHVTIVPGTGLPGRGPLGRGRRGPCGARRGSRRGLRSPRATRPP